MNSMPQEPKRNHTTNEYQRDKTTEENQVHNSKTARDQNAKERQGRGRPTKKNER